MAKPWTVPTGDDLWQVVSRDVVRKVDEDSAGGTYEANDFDGSLDTRSKKAIDAAVQMIRDAVETGGKYPLSITEGSVPPGATRHALALAAYQLVGPKPSLVSIVMMDGGVSSPLTTLHNDAKKWIADVERGMVVELPEDPCGQDYETAVSDDNPAIRSIRWGDQVASDTEYEAGETSEGLTLPIDFTTD